VPADLVRWGVLGAADIAIRRLIPAIQSTPGNAVVAIASRDLARAQAVAANLSIERAYGSYTELLEDDRVDVVYNPLPNSLHAEWTIRAAEAGKHVLCEKPMAPTVAECEHMVSACQKAGVRLMEGFMYRFHPQHARVRELLAEGAIGDVRMMRSSFCVRMQRPPEDIRFAAAMGGGALLDVGVYAIDAVRMTLGADPLSTTGSISLGPSGIDLSAAAALSFADGVLASVTCSFVANGGGSYEVLGSAGKLTVHQPFAQPPGSPPRLTWDSPDGLREEAFPPDINQYVLMIEAFSAALRDGAPTPIPAKAGIGNIRVIETLLASPLK
jgi:predicted dehydrogenase